MNVMMQSAHSASLATPLGLVALAAILLLSVASRRWLPRLRRQPVESPVTVVGRCVLESRKVLYLVSAGGELTLIGTTESSIHLLRAFSISDAVAAPWSNTTGVACESDTLNPVVLIGLMMLLGIAPVAVLMLSSFLKISIVLSILRSALGTQQVPPTQVINGLALILTCFIMTPVARDIYTTISNEGSQQLLKQKDFKSFERVAARAVEPLRVFLAKNTHERDITLFFELSADRPTGGAAGGDVRFGNRSSSVGMRVLMPAFVTSELKEAFQAGFLIYLPFLVIDLVVANTLIALGMQMMQPAFVALPVKLLLFILIDGWYLVVKNLVLSYS